MLEEQMTFFSTDKFNILRHEKMLSTITSARTIDASSAGRNENGNESQPTKLCRMEENPSH
jgi:hypothetical protein